MTGKLVIEKLARGHDVDAFDCGKEPLNRFLSRYALQNQKAEASQTYVAVIHGRIIGYYTLVVGEVAYDRAGERLKKGLARHPVPIMVLARLAVSTDMQGKGVGSGLLKDALMRTISAADIAGIRAMIVHAKDEAKGFYERYDFTASPTDPYHLFVLIKDAKASLGT